MLSCSMLTVFLLALLVFNCTHVYTFQFSRQVDFAVARKLSKFQSTFKTSQPIQMIKTGNQVGSGGAAEIVNENVEVLHSPNFDDMKYLAFLLANITEVMDTQPELALTIVSKQMGWLYSRNVPKLVHDYHCKFESPLFDRFSL